MKLAGKSRAKVALNLTSLIDVLFILIIFFTVSSTFLEQPGIELDLPEAKSAEGHTIQKTILYIDPDENIFLNEQMISLNTLPGEITKLAETLKNTGIVLKADEKTSHGLVIRIMDILRQAGVYKVIVSTSSGD